MKSSFKRMSALLFLLSCIAIQPLCGMDASDTQESIYSHKKLLLAAGAAALVGLGLYWWTTSSTPSKATPPEKKEPAKTDSHADAQSSHQEVPVQQPLAVQQTNAQPPKQEVPVQQPLPVQQTEVPQDPTQLLVSDSDEEEPEDHAAGFVVIDRDPVEQVQVPQPQHNPREINKQKIEEYIESPLHTYCTVTRNDVFNKIHRGHTKLQEILDGTLLMDAHPFNLEATHADRHTHLENMVSICWYLYAVAASKDQAFDEGSFIVHDNGALYNYLLGYVQNVNPYWDGCVSQSSNPYGYCRHSTHLKEAQHQGNHHYGIDIRFGDSLNWWEYWVPADKQQQPLLPAGKKHILFGRIDAQRTFIKMENDGLYRYDGWTQHAAGAFGSVARKLGFGSNDLNSYRKEHMPEHIQREMKQLIKQHNLQLETPKTIGQIIKAAPVHAQLNDFAARLQEQYDHADNRFGNEVIIIADELRLRLPDNFV